MESSHQALYPDNLAGYGIPDFRKADKRLQPDAADIDDARIYPNPFDSHAQLGLYSKKEGQILQLKVYNIMGQLVYAEQQPSLSRGHNQISLDHIIKDLNTGLYHFSFLSEDRIYSIKAIKVQ